MDGLMTSMLQTFGPSKWTMVKWTTYIRLILTIHMDKGPMAHQYYANLDRPNGQRSNGPFIFRQFGQSKWTTVHWTAYIVLICTELFLLLAL